MTSPPQPLNPPKPSLEQKLAQAQADAAKWTQIAENPNVSPEAKQVALIAARSSKAAARLYRKALTWEREE